MNKPIDENSEQRVIDESVEATKLQRILTQGSLSSKRDHISLQLDLSGQTATYLCKLIGILGEAYLLATHPSSKTELAPLRLNQDVCVKTFDGLEFKQYAGLVEKIFYTPEPFILIKLKSDARAAQQRIRRAKRVAATLTTTIHLGANIGVTAVITDISVGGAMLLVPKPIPDEVSQFTITIDVPYKDWVNQVETEAEIKRRTTNSLDGDDIYSVSVSFRDLPRQTDLVISHYVAQSLLEQH